MLTIRDQISAERETLLLIRSFYVDEYEVGEIPNHEWASIDRKLDILCEDHLNDPLMVAEMLADAAEFWG